MRPRLLAEAETSVTGSSDIRPTVGGSWLVCDPDAELTRILDRRLQIVATVPGPHDSVGGDTQHIAVIAEGRLAVSDVHGRLLWHREVVEGTECHVDSRGILWTLAGDLLAAADVATGHLFGHTRLGTTYGWSDWIDDPMRTWTGLHLNHGNGTCHSWLARPATGSGIQLNAIAVPTLTAFHHAEPRYLAMSHHAARLTVRDIATDTVIADRTSETLAGPDNIRPVLSVCRSRRSRGLRVHRPRRCGPPAVVVIR